MSAGAGSTPARWLHVVRADGVGGVERVLAALVDEMRRIGVHVELVALEPPPRGPGMLQHLDPLVLEAAARSGPRRRLGQLRSLRRLIADLRPDVVVGHGPSANGLVSLARGRRGPTTFVMEHGDPLVPWRRRWNRTFLWTYRRADAVVVLSEMLAAELRTRWRPPRRIDVVPNGLHPDVPFVVGGDREPVIATVGRLHPQKAQADLLRAVALAGDGLAGWSVLVVGDGRERAALEQLADDLGIGHRTRFVGMHPAPWELLASASLFVHCSRNEGFANAIVEAFASGCAVVSSDCRWGPLELIEDGVDGILYPVGDVDRLAAILVDLVGDPDRRAALAAAGVDRARPYAIGETARRWLELAEAVAADR